MKIPMLTSLLAVLLLAACSDNKSKPTSTSGNPLNAASEYGNALATGQARAIKTVDVASLNQAIQMFNVNEGRFPKDLDELVASKLIVKIPDAPYGMKLVYDASAGTVKVVKE